MSVPALKRQKMKKNDYKKPTIRVVKIEKRLLQTGTTPQPGDQEARGYRGGRNDWDE